MFHTNIRSSIDINSDIKKKEQITWILMLTFKTHDYYWKLNTCLIILTINVQSCGTYYFRKYLVRQEKENHKQKECMLDLKTQTLLTMIEDVVNEHVS